MSRLRSLPSHRQTFHHLNHFLKDAFGHGDAPQAVRVETRREVAKSFTLTPEEEHWRSRTTGHCRCRRRCLMYNRCSLLVCCRAVISRRWLARSVRPVMGRIES